MTDEEKELEKQDQCHNGNASQCISFEVLW
jgi:hypothetical protein